MKQIPLDLSLFEDMSEGDIYNYLEGKYSEEVKEEVKDYVELMYGKIDKDDNIIEI